jgi:hypothetical protein
VEETSHGIGRIFGNVSVPATIHKRKRLTEEKIKVESAFQKDNSLKTFVPRWIIAKTCLAQGTLST